MLERLFKKICGADDKLCQNLVIGCWIISALISIHLLFVSVNIIEKQKQLERKVDVLFEKNKVCFCIGCHADVTSDRCFAYSLSLKEKHGGK